MMKVSRSFLAVAIAVIMTCVFVNTSSIATAETYPARATKVLVLCDEKYSLQGTTQGRYLTGGVPPVRFSM